MNRGNEGQRIFRDDRDAAYFLRRLRRICKELGARVHAYCLMPNHFHLLIEVASATLATLMHRIQTAYSWHFNSRYEHRGHVFQGRYHAILCTNDRYLKQLIAYIHLNPVKAGLVADPAAWPWSSHRVFLGLQRSSLVDPRPVLAVLGDDMAAARTNYADLLGAVDLGRLPELDDLADWLDETAGVGEAPDGREREVPPSLPIVLEGVCARLGVLADEVRGPTQRRDICKARMAFVAESLKAGRTERELADFLGRGRSAVAMMLSRAANRDDCEP